MNTSHAVFVAAVAAAVAANRVVAFNESWNNGTGYFDGAVKDETLADLESGIYTCNTGGLNNRNLLIAVKCGKVYVAFERFSGGDKGVLCYNSPRGESFDRDLGFAVWMENYSTKVVSTAQIVEAAKATGGVVIDDHSGKESSLQAIVRWTKGDREFVCPAYAGTYFSLNDLYINEDGKVHLSSWSVAGTVDCRQGIEAGIEKFNTESEANSHLLGGWGKLELVAEF